MSTTTLPNRPIIYLEHKHQWYAVRLRESIASSRYIGGDVYLVQECSTRNPDGTHGGTFLCGFNSKLGCDIVYDINDPNAEILFQFNYCWRGVWEGRLYFPMQEYWSTCLDEMNEVWKQLRLLLREQIMFHKSDYNWEIFKDEPDE